MKDIKEGLKKQDNIKYPKEMILNLKHDNKLHIKLEKVIYLPQKYCFQATILISDTLVDSDLQSDLIEFITEEK